MVSKDDLVLHPKNSVLTRIIAGKIVDQAMENALVKQYSCKRYQLEAVIHGKGVLACVEMVMEGGLNFVSDLYRETFINIIMKDIITPVERESFMNKFHTTVRGNEDLTGKLVDIILSMDSRIQKNAIRLFVMGFHRFLIAEIISTMIISLIS